jgi:hypothetical protein
MVAVGVVLWTGVPVMFQFCFGGDYEGAGLSSRGVVLADLWCRLGCFMVVRGGCQWRWCALFRRWWCALFRWWWCGEAMVAAVVVRCD